MVDHHLQRVALAIELVFPILSTIILALRLYSRKYLTKHLGVDDALIVAAWVLVVPETYTSWMYIIINHVGIHASDIKSTNVVLGQKYDYANQLAYNPILSLVKMSVILFLLRLNGQQKSIRIFAWITLAITLVLMILVLFIDAFQCWPVAYVYDTSIKGGKCIKQGAFFISTACLTLLTDILVLILPTWMAVRLQMKLRQKLIVISLLSLGLIVTAVGVYRMVLLIQVYYPTHVNPDPTYDIGFCSSAVETNLAIMTACAPAIKPLVIRYLPSLLSLTSASRRPTGRTYYGPGKSIYGTGTQVSIRGGKSTAFEMSNLRPKRDPGNESGDNESEKAIMEYNGIVRSVDVSVSYVGARGEQDDGIAHHTDVRGSRHGDGRHTDSERGSHGERESWREGNER